MAQETQPFTATPLSPDSLITIEKASASSANPGMASVIVQLKDEPLATYGGGIPGLDPTSPRVTGEKKLNLNSRASQAYLNHLAKKHADFKGQAQAHLNKVQFTQDYDLVLNGVAALVPLEQLSDLGALPGGGLGAQAASSRIAANQERRSIFRLILRLYGISRLKQT